MYKKIQVTLLFCLMLGAFTACYRMPTEDDCSLVPCTNNPAITRAKENPLMPGMAY